MGRGSIAGRTNTSQISEAGRNAIRHAHARAIAVRLTATPTDVELAIVDDGIGFVASERAGNGLGLRSIHERVRLNAGHVLVESRLGGGTRVTVRVPIPVSSQVENVRP